MSGEHPGGPDDEPVTGRVLVVEDDTLNRRLLARGVEQEGHAVHTAEHGAAALELLEREPIDLVLLDLVMPVLDGFAVLDAMARDQRFRAIPVLVISAVDDSEAAARAIGMGAIDVLPKPFDPVMLRVRLRTALQASRLRQLEQAYLRQELTMRQQEKLATLGRLSAGLAHELNNPAAAAVRTTQRLGQRLDELSELLVDVVERPDAAAILSAAEALAGAAAPGALAAVDRIDLEDAMAAALGALGVGGAPQLALRLVAAGLSEASVRPAVEALAAADRTAAVRWLAARAEIRAATDQLASSIGRISEIIGALRSYSYVDRAPRQDVDVRVGLEDSLTMLAHKIPDGVVVVRDHEEDLPAIHAHGSQLNQVWTNLLDNALDALGGQGTVTVRTRAADGGIVVEIADDGPGIPDELAARVFDPFVTTKAPGEGTGLGLNISHQIVTEVHGGRLSVESEPGRTVFTAWLPGGGPDHEVPHAP